MKKFTDDLSLFETNDFSNMNIIEFVDGDKVSNIYWMDDFYKRPYDVYDYLTSVEPPLWKVTKEWKTDKKSRNTIDFEDRRHMMQHPGMENLMRSLGEICFQEANDTDIVTNFTRFSKTKLCESHYWWPHHDSGYNGICYLSRYDEIGTNLYKPRFIDRPDILPLDENNTDRDEHGRPWEPKSYWEVVLRLRSKFNRFVMFEGSYYYHSMNLTGENYFADHWSNAEYRINQVFFLSEKKYGST